MKHFFTLILLFFLFSETAFAQDFRFMGRYNSLGVPEYAEAQRDVIDTALLAVIARNLPENKPVPQFHPDFISQNSETDVLLLKPAEVWVTFVNEAADFTNTLGFYTYDSNNPPRSAADIRNPTIIFPNVSFENSGGGLKAGIKVKLGKFEAGTGIGWFLIANGWQNGRVTPGLYTLFSETPLNPENNPTLKAHTVLLNDQRGKKLILGFEDTRRDQVCDNDFNDALFYVTLSQDDAIAATHVVTVTPKSSDVPSPNPQNPTYTNEYNKNKDKTTDTRPADDKTASGSTTQNNANTNNGGTSSNTGNNVINNGNNNTVIINNTTVINDKNNAGSGASSGADGNLNLPGNSGALPGNPAPGNRGNGNNGLPEMTVCQKQGLSGAEFDYARKTVAARYVEEQKKTVIRQVVRNKRVSVSQVIAFLKIIKVEQYRLEMAKYLFDFTCDKSRYYLVNDVLVANSIRELDAFLKDKNTNDDLTAIPGTDMTRQTAEVLNQTTPQPGSQPQKLASACGNNALAATRLEELKSSIASKPFSGDKMTVLKQAIQNSCLAVVQVKELMGLFSFETDKLAVAKYLYDFTGDKQNYFKVNDAFGFQSTISELDNYLKTKK